MGACRFQKGRVGWRPSSGSRAWPGLAAATPTMGHTWSTREHPFNEWARVQQAFTGTDRVATHMVLGIGSVHPHASHTHKVTWAAEPPAQGHPTSPFQGRARQGLTGSLSSPGQWWPLWSDSNGVTQRPSEKLTRTFAYLHAAQEVLVAGCGL